MIAKFTLPALLIAFATLFPATAWADAIDGNWCFKGKTLSIDGPKIVTPGGTKMTGDYHRHGFSYTVPKRERGAGSKIVILQEDETTMHLTRNGGKPKTGTPGPGAAKSEVWKRCDLTT